MGNIFHSKFDSKAKDTAVVIHKSISFESDKIIAEPNGTFDIDTRVSFNKRVSLTNV